MKSAKTISLFLATALPALFLAAPSLYAKSEASVKYSLTREENPKGSKNVLILPYVFSTESMGFTFGVGGATKGYWQDQLLMGATVLASTEDAAVAVAGVWDYKMP